MLRAPMTRAVLTFHSVDDSGSVLSFPVNAFRRLIERLAATGVPVVPFDELLRRRHGIAITFDDGMRTVRENALPVLRDHGFASHLFLATGLVGTSVGWPSHGGVTANFDMLGWNEVEECARSGIRMECHTVTHPDLRALAPARIVDECAQADDEIERRVGRRPTLVAYPFGFYDDAVRSTLAPRYAGCFTTRLGYLGRADDLSRIPRLDSYYLQAPTWYERILSVTTRSYVLARSAIRTVRGKQ